jgi:hypothetical protein
VQRGAEVLDKVCKLTVSMRAGFACCWRRQHMGSWWCILHPDQLQVAPAHVLPAPPSIV